jgi:hypothetical protein
MINNNSFTPQFADAANNIFIYDKIRLILMGKSTAKICKNSLKKH